MLVMIQVIEVGIFHSAQMMVDTFSPSIHIRLTVRLPMVCKIELFDVLGSGLGRWHVEVLLASIGMVIMEILSGFFPVSSG